MKVHLFNLLLLITVGGCLYITLSSAAPEAQPVSELHRAFVTLQPTATPHPIDFYRQSRTAQRAENLQALQTLMGSGAPSLAQAAREALLSQSAASEMEQKVEGMLAGMGYEKSVCVFQNNTVTLFTQPAVAEEDAAFVLQSAADICQVEKENVQLLSP